MNITINLADGPIYRQVINLVRAHARPRQRIAGTKVDVAFIGSCTNGRLSDARE